jgi:hypothetical protein
VQYSFNLKSATIQHKYHENQKQKSNLCPKSQ